MVLYIEKNFSSIFRYVFFPIKLETGIVSFVGGQRWTLLNNGNASGNRAFKKRNEQDCSSTANENASCWMNFFSHRKNIIGIRIFLPNNGKLFCVATSILIKLHLLYQQLRRTKGIFFWSLRDTKIMIERNNNTIFPQNCSILIPSNNVVLKNDR